MRHAGPALLLLIAGVVTILLLGFALAFVATPSHTSGGCNYIPLVNGKPAYNCNSGLPRNQVLSLGLEP